ncbi:hypothetical protein D3C87_1617650 [compost metagenome]
MIRQAVSQGQGEGDALGGNQQRRRIVVARVLVDPHRTFQQADAQLAAQAFGQVAIPAHIQRVLVGQFDGGFEVLEEGHAGHQARALPDGVQAAPGRWPGTPNDGVFMDLTLRREHGLKAQRDGLFGQSPGAGVVFHGVTRRLRCAGRQIRVNIMLFSINV